MNCLLYSNVEAYTALEVLEFAHAIYMNYLFGGVLLCIVLLVLQLLSQPFSSMLIV